jgi:3-hydroxyacyl-[acyl-carrier-protein] dehydratase
LVVESFGQACGLLRAASTGAEGVEEGLAPVVAKLAGVRFVGDVLAGDLLEHAVELLVKTEQGAVFCGQSTVAGKPILKVARIVAAHAPIAAFKPRAAATQQ